MNSRTIASKIFFSVVFFKILDECWAVQCYRCQVAPSYRLDNATTPLCAKFDGSGSFVVDCPYSTMCLKKILKLELQHGQTVETITRDCASQKYNDQVYKQGAWRIESKVEEPYEEGCKDLNENHLSASSSTYCHCRGNLCNSGKKESPSYHTDAMAVIFVFNALKYINSGVAYY